MEAPETDRWATDPFKAKSFRMLPEGFWVGALFYFRFLFGTDFRRSMDNSSFAKPIGFECFRKSSWSEPLFYFQVLLGTHFRFGMSVPEPDRLPTAPSKTERARVLPKGFLVGALFLRIGSVQNRCLFWGDGLGARSISNRTFQSRSGFNASRKCSWPGLVSPWGSLAISTLLLD